jgi:hypothetical protein
VRFAGQPSLDAFDCRPYEWGPVEACDLTAPAGATAVFISVQGYEDNSSYQLKIESGASSSRYVFNDTAAKLMHVKLDVDFTDGSGSGTDGWLGGQLDSFTGTDSYEYVLELDSTGKIFGGEWIGESKRRHPDFVWLPTGRRYESVAGGAITYANVKRLLDASTGATGGGGAGSAQVLQKNGALAKGAWQVYGPFVVTSGTLQARLSGTGDADLYVKKGVAPNISTFDCRPYTDGSTESCDGAGAGSYWVGVNGYAATSTYQLEVRWTGTAAAF